MGWFQSAQPKPLTICDKKIYGIVEGDEIIEYPFKLYHSLSALVNRLLDCRFMIHNLKCSFTR